MNTNEVLANIGLELMGHQRRIPVPEPERHLNKCQSTNDAYPTGFRIAVYASNRKLIDAINQLREGFDRKAKRVRNHPENGPHPAAGRSADDPRPEFHAFSVLLNEETRNLHRTAEAAAGS